MRDNQTEEINQYFKGIQESLHCTNRQKKRCMADIRSSMDEYLVDHPEASMSEIYKHFGSVEEIADAFIWEEDSEELHKRANMSRWVKRAILVAAVLVSVMLLIGIVRYIAYRNGYYVETITASSDGAISPKERGTFVN